MPVFHRKWIALAISVFSMWASADQLGVRLINGTVVNKEDYPEIISIRSGNAGCTATVVGPRAIITAGHCASNGATATFTTKGKSYSAKIYMSPLYQQGTDHDISIGITTQDIEGVKPVSIGGEAVVGTELILFGFGCFNVGGGNSDGKLRMGPNTVVSFSNYDMVSERGNGTGAALCYGDSGGPAFVMVNGKRLLLGVNSKGNIRDRNLNARTDHTQSKSFFQSLISSQQVQLCGINLNCGEPPVDPPTCRLIATPPQVKKNVPVSLRLESSGTVETAKINGTVVAKPVGTLEVATPNKGSFTATGEVTGPNNTKGTCQASYVVDDEPPPPTPPSCRLTANPSSISLGAQVVLEMKTEGTVNEASIDGSAVSFPTGSRTIQPDKAGTFTATGRVGGPNNASATCTASYQVNGTGPLPTPNYAIIRTYCGPNSESSRVAKVCLGVVRRIGDTIGATIAEVVQVEYSDGTKDTLPVLYKKKRPKTEGDPKTEEDWIVYNNKVKNVSASQVLDTRYAILTKFSDGQGNEVPTSLMGKSGSDPAEYYIVNKLTMTP